MLERYEIKHEIGRGAMGVVYLAVDTESGTEVALKELAMQEGLTPERQEEALARFKREAETIQGLESSHIVSVLDSFSEDERHFMVMEYLGGATLGDVLKNGPLPTDAALGVVEQILDALTVAHKAGVVHRDLKPENIFVLDDGLVKVADFGVVHLEESPSNLTRAGQVLGTIGYMSPEQVRGETVDQRADIFAVGVMFYEMLVGLNPFGAEQPTTTMYRISYEEPPSLLPLVAALPPHAAAIVRKAMAKEADLRYQSAEEMLSDLRQDVTPDLSAIEAAAVARVASPETAAASPAPSAARRVPWKPLVAGLIAVVLVGGGAYAFMTMRNNQESAEAAEREAITCESIAVVRHLDDMEWMISDLEHAIAGIEEKAETNAREVDAWDAEWASRQQAYSAEVARVNEHNRLERQRYEDSYWSYSNWWFGTFEEGYSYDPSYLSPPRQPQQPAKITVDINPELNTIARVQGRWEGVQSTIASEQATCDYYSVVYERLVTAADALGLVLDESLAAGSASLRVDGSKGQILDAHAFDEVDMRDMDEAFEALRTETALYLANFGFTQEQIEAERDRRDELASDEATQTDTDASTEGE